MDSRCQTLWGVFMCMGRVTALSLGDQSLSEREGDQVGAFAFGSRLHRTKVGAHSGGTKVSILDSVAALHEKRTQQGGW